MIFSDFETTTHGKWILAGEHSVLRGHEAIVFPIQEKKLFLTYNASPVELTAEYNGECGSDLHLLFWGVLEHGMHLLNLSINSLRGHFKLHCNIPIGAGMGASAALCVATARWFAYQKFIEQESIFTFSKSLENLFHGESSGLDIAGANAEHGVYFKNGQYKIFIPAWQPHWYLSSCEQLGITSHCIQQVQHLWDKNITQAQLIDKQMRESVIKAHRALIEFNENSNSDLAIAINQASNCFQQWGLISDSLNHHMQQLQRHGAIAVKPTGSGGGGHTISLWSSPPPNELELTKLQICPN